MSLPQATISGRIGKILQATQTLTRMSVACDENKKLPNGEWEKTTHWYNIAFFNKMAEKIKRLETVNKVIGAEVIVLVEIRTFKNKQGFNEVSLLGKDLVIGNFSKFEKPIEDMSNQPPWTEPTFDSSEEIPF